MKSQEGGRKVRGSAILNLVMYLCIIMAAVTEGTIATDANAV